MNLFLMNLFLLNFLLNFSNRIFNKKIISRYQNMPARAGNPKRAIESHSQVCPYARGSVRSSMISLLLYSNGLPAHANDKYFC